MTNISYFITYFVLGLISITLLVITQINRKMCPTSISFRLLCASLLFWIGCNAATHVIKDLRITLFIKELKFIGVATAPVFLLLFAAQLTGVSRWIDKTARALFFLIPAITVGLCMTNDHHFIFRQAVWVATENPMRFVTQNGLWFYIHTAYCYILMLACVGMCLWGLGKTPPEKRLPLWVLMITVFCSVAANAVTILVLKDSPLDGSLVSIAIVMPFVYWSMVAAAREDRASLEREELFGSIANPVFVLDDQRRVTQMNRAAQELCDALHIPNFRDLRPDERVMDYLIQHAAKVDGARTDSGQDLLLEIQGQQRAYSISERNFHDSRGGLSGTFVTLTDITEIRRLVQRLEREAGVDILTGLMNRNEYEQALHRLDKPENLPLSVIMGDLNNLKIVNDTFGHEEGDNMLRSIGEILLRCAPNGSTVARIGGDEFVMLMARMPHPQALSVADRIRAATARHKNPRYRLSISLGCATKTTSAQDLRQIIETADQHMYREKRSLTAKTRATGGMLS